MFIYCDSLCSQTFPNHQIAPAVGFQPLAPFAAMTLWTLWEECGLYCKATSWAFRCGNRGQWDFSTCQVEVLNALTMLPPLFSTAFACYVVKRKAKRKNASCGDPALSNVSDHHRKISREKRERDGKILRTQTTWNCYKQLYVFWICLVLLISSFN